MKPASAHPAVEQETVRTTLSEWREQIIRLEELGHLADTPGIHSFLKDVKEWRPEPSDGNELNLQMALRLLEIAKCPNCDGSGAIPVPLGEHFVSADMAQDAGEPSMAGQSMGIEWGVEQCQWCDERKKCLSSHAPESEKQVGPPHCAMCGKPPHPDSTGHSYRPKRETRKEGDSPLTSTHTTEQHQSNTGSSAAPVVQPDSAAAVSEEEKWTYSTVWDLLHYGRMAGIEAIYKAHNASLERHAKKALEKEKLP